MEIISRGVPGDKLATRTLRCPMQWSSQADKWATVEATQIAEPKLWDVEPRNHKDVPALNSLTPPLTLLNLNPLD